MVALEQQYIKIRKLEEEATQKLSKFTADKKRIDILETDFGKLLGLSDSIDKKLLELTGTNDDLQQIQVQLRRFDETIGDVNSRYERLEKKALVLDRTVEGIDAAFEQLRSVETAVAEYRKTIEAVPSEIEELGRTLGELRDTGGKAALVMERLSALDSILEDVEKRTEKMQTAREWLARTETRLEEISRQSQDQLKLLSDLLKEENPAKKSKGAPPIGIRENVVKLAHQGWKVDEIARALHLSRGEVELILELPSN
jgi:chromosome segregation ATPase